MYCCQISWVKFIFLTLSSPVLKYSEANAKIDILHCDLWKRRNDYWMIGSAETCGRFAAVLV